MKSKVSNMTITKRTESKHTNESSKSLAQLVCEFLDENKAENITILDLKGKAVFADAMVIATGSSGRFLKSLADKLKEFLHKQGYSDIHIEGAQTCDWVLVDSGDVVIHLFRPEVRELYNLEKMWGAEL